jgi:hypothetical protein
VVDEKSARSGGTRSWVSELKTVPVKSLILRLNEFRDKPKMSDPTAEELAST